MKKKFVLLLIISALMITIKSENFSDIYVNTLLSEMSVEDKDEIANLDESELIKLHLSYGMGIRNRWFWGFKNPPLILHMYLNGIFHPDGMSNHIIERIWEKVHSDINPQRSNGIP